MSRERDLAYLRQNLASLSGSSTRLTRSVAKLAPLFPLTDDLVANLSADQQDQIDAFLKRFEQVLTTLQDQIFRGIAKLENRELTTMSHRDVVELMERMEVVESSSGFRKQAELRNRLAHMYPHDPRRQANILNQAFAAAPDMLATARRAEQFIAREYQIGSAST